MFLPFTNISFYKAEYENSNYKNEKNETGYIQKIYLHKCKIQSESGKNAPFYGLFVGSPWYDLMIIYMVF